MWLQAKHRRTATLLHYCTGPRVLTTRTRTANASLANLAEGRLVRSSPTHRIQLQRTRRGGKEKLRKDDERTALLPVHRSDSTKRCMEQQVSEGEKPKSNTAVFCREQTCFLRAAVHPYHQELALHLAQSSVQGLQVFHSTTFAHSANSKVSCTYSFPLPSPLCPPVS